MPVLPARPAAGDPVRQDWGLRLVESVRASSPARSASVLTRGTTAGTIHALAPAVPRFARPDQTGPWAITVRGLKADFKNCLYRRGPATKELADITDADLPSTGLVCYLSAEINAVTGAATILAAATLAGVTDATLPAVDDPARIRLLLYKLARPAAAATTDPESGVVTSAPEWSVACNLWDIPVATLYS
jgi:hypothetical protein